MTRETFDTAYVVLDKIAKIVSAKEKIKREFPEFEYNTESKEVGDLIFNVLNEKLSEYQNLFDAL